MGRDHKIIVYAYVVGDILHRGHLRHLSNAKALGDILIIGVLTDEAVMEEKPKPIMSFDERISLVGSLDFVDLVVPQAIYSPVENLQQIKPDIVVECAIHPRQLVNEVRNCVTNYGGKLIILPYYPIQSSSKIKEEIRKDDRQ